jgi:hypothetical protein
MNAAIILLLIAMMILPAVIVIGIMTRKRP